MKKLLLYVFIIVSQIPSSMYAMEIDLSESKPGNTIAAALKTIIKNGTLAEFNAQKAQLDQLLHSELMSLFMISGSKRKALSIVHQLGVKSAKWDSLKEVMATVEEIMAKVKYEPGTMPAWEQYVQRELKQTPKKTDTFVALSIIKQTGLGCSYKALKDIMPKLELMAQEKNIPAAQEYILTEQSKFASINTVLSAALDRYTTVTEHSDRGFSRVLLVKKEDTSQCSLV